MMKRITDEKARELYIKYNTPINVIGHCKAVSDTATVIAEKLNENGYNFDLDLIRGAGLVHDLNRTEENHGEVCASILEAIGYCDEAQIVREHMHYDFNDFDNIDERDLMCLGDRLVKEDRYVGLDERIDYIIHKGGENPEKTKRILAKKKETQQLMNQIESVIGQTIDSIFLKGNYNYNENK